MCSRDASACNPTGTTLSKATVLDESATHVETFALLATSSTLYATKALPLRLRRPGTRDYEPVTPIDHPQERVRCKSVTLRKAYSVPKHTSAICVQSFDDSLNSAIHITYRISLRSSSLREPRYPLLRVLDRFDSATSGNKSQLASSHNQTNKTEGFGC